MTGIVRVCCLTLVSVACVVPARADDAAEARQLIDKAIKAGGGAAALAKNPAATTKMKGKFYGMGEGIDYSGTFATPAPDRFYFEIKMTIANQDFTIQQALKGAKGWMAINGKAQDLAKEQIDEVREGIRVHEVSRLLPLAGKDYKLSTLGDAKVDNNPALGVHVEYKGRRDVNLFFDKKSGLLVKIATRGKDPMAGDQEFAADTYYRDYKKVGDVMVPHKVEIRRDDKLFVDGELTEFTPSEKLDDALLTKP